MTSTPSKPPTKEECLAFKQRLDVGLHNPFERVDPRILEQLQKLTQTTRTHFNLDDFEEAPV